MVTQTLRKKKTGRLAPNRNLDEFLDDGTTTWSRAVATDHFCWRAVVFALLLGTFSRLEVERDLMENAVSKAFVRRRSIAVNEAI